MKKGRGNAKTVLITGGAGYIGSVLARDMAGDARWRGARIRIFDNLRRHHLCGLMDLPRAAHYELIEGDILDRLNLERAMQGVQTVFHLAAIVKTPLSFDHPEWTQQVNHWGTANVVECALRAGVERFVYASSASVYGPGGPFREDAACHPVGPYATSKLQGEREVLQAAQRGLVSTIVRLGTVFGSAPAMRFDAVASRLAYLVGVGRPMVIHGSGSQRRPLIHVADASAALRLCAASPRALGMVVNAVAMNPTVSEIARQLARLVPSARIQYTDQDLLTEVSFSVESRRLSSLGFKPRFGLERGLRDVLARWRGFHPAAVGTP